MPASIVVGAQWGDEGKGKTTDFLAEQVAMVVRYQGGDNAGHTVVIGDETFKLHLVPSGALHPHISPIIGPGVVVNPRTLLEEIAMLLHTRKATVGLSTGIVTTEISRTSRLVSGGPNRHCQGPFLVTLKKDMPS